MKAKIAISIDEEVLKKLKQIADEETRTISNLFEKIAKDFIEGK